MIDNFLLSISLRYCNDFTRCAYRNIDERSHLVKFRKNFRSLSDLKNCNVIIAAIFFVDVNNSKLFTLCSSRVIEEYFRNDFDNERLIRFR